MAHSSLEISPFCMPYSLLSLSASISESKDSCSVATVFIWSLLSLLLSFSSTQLSISLLLLSSFPFQASSDTALVRILAVDLLLLFVIDGSPKNLYI